MAKEKVLVVDDERPVVMVIETNLKIAGYQVLTAYNGRDALEKIREEQPACVLLDVMMPEMNGWEVLRTIRSDSRIERTQVIMLTAMADDSDITKGYELGVDHYLTKPFEPEELLEFVERVIEMGKDEELID
jgi:two-component system, OmpR family, alkaline phosphatase synthesis response regulator PhoP